MPGPPLPPNRKLTLDDAVAMRMARRAGRPAAELSAEYRVDRSHTFSILRGDSHPARVLVDLDDETYVALARGARLAKVSVAEYAAQVLRDAAR